LTEKSNEAAIILSALLNLEWVGDVRADAAEVELAGN
jgi:hypothetical protein